MASLLLFSENPSNDIPRACAIRIARYDTKDDEPERDSLTDDLITIEGPLKAKLKIRTIKSLSFIVRT